MTGLQMIECHLKETALMRFLYAQGLAGIRREPGYWLRSPCLAQGSVRRVYPTPLAALQ